MIIIDFGIVLFFWYIFIKALCRVVRMVRGKKSYPNNIYSYKYDPYILDRVMSPNSELNMQNYQYRTNIEGNSLKKMAIANNLFEEKTTMEFLNDYLEK